MVFLHSMTFQAQWSPCSCSDHIHQLPFTTSQTNRREQHHSLNYTGLTQNIDTWPCVNITYLGKLARHCRLCSHASHHTSYYHGYTGRSHRGTCRCDCRTALPLTLQHNIHSTVRNSNSIISSIVTSSSNNSSSSISSQYQYQQ